MLTIEILGYIVTDAKVVNKIGHKHVAFTVVHKEMTQFLGGHNVYIECQLDTKDGCLIAQLKKGRSVFVRGNFLIVKNNGRYGDGSTSYVCRVSHVELVG